MEYNEPLPIINKPASRLYEAIKKAAKIDRAPAPHSTRSPLGG